MGNGSAKLGSQVESINFRQQPRFRFRGKLSFRRLSVAGGVLDLGLDALQFPEKGMARWLPFRVGFNPRGLGQSTAGTLLLLKRMQIAVERSLILHQQIIPPER
jgi:hypothetical protein